MSKYESPYEKFDKSFNSILRYDKYIKNPRVDLDDFKSYTVTEKLDGSNFRFVFISEHEIMFGSRTICDIAIANIKTKEINIVNKESYKQFRKFIKFVFDKILKRYEKCVELGTDEKFINIISKNKVFFGEAMNKVTLPYNINNSDLFRGFAVYDLDENSYVSYRHMVGFFVVLGLDYQEVLISIEDSKLTDDLLNTKFRKFVTKNNHIEYTLSQIVTFSRGLNLKSEYDDKTIMEGVIIQSDINPNAFIKVKTNLFEKYKPIKDKSPISLEKIFNQEFNIESINSSLDEMIESGKYNKKSPYGSIVGKFCSKIFDDRERDIKKYTTKEFNKMIDNSELKNEIMKSIEEKLNNK